MDDVSGRAPVPAGDSRAGGASWRWLAAAALVVARHPSLWAVGIRQVVVLAAPGWWRRRPFLPLPAPDYLRFRLQTAYGGDGTLPPEPADVVTYLRWCRGLG